MKRDKIGENIQKKFKTIKHTKKKHVNLYRNDRNNNNANDNTRFWVVTKQESKGAASY